MAGEQRLDVIGARYIDWLIPGLVGMNIMGTGMWGVGFAIVWARSRKLLKRLAATPMSRVALPAGDNCSARLLFLVVEVGALLVFAGLVFSVPVFGSVFVLAVVGRSWARLPSAGCRCSSRAAPRRSRRRRAG